MARTWVTDTDLPVPLMYPSGQRVTCVLGDEDLAPYAVQREESAEEHRKFTLWTNITRLRYATMPIGTMLEVRRYDRAQCLTDWERYEKLKEGLWCVL